MAFHPNTAGGGFVIGDPVTGGTTPAVIYIGAGNVIAQSPTDFFYTAASSRLNLAGTNSIASAVFVGTGLNNLTSGGTFTGNQDHLYNVSISLKANLTYNNLIGGTFSDGDTITQTTGAGTGTTATAINDDGASAMDLNAVVPVGGGFANGQTISNGLGVTATIVAAFNQDFYDATKDGISLAVTQPIVAGAIALDEGVTFTFATLTGHDLGDNWDIQATAKGHVNAQRGYFFNGSYFLGSDSANNILLGVGAGSSLNPAVADSNVFIGTSAGGGTTQGGKNVYVGHQAGLSNTSGEENVFIGNVAGFGNTSGQKNVFIGTNSGATAVQNYNVAVGGDTALTLTTGDSNTLLGYGTNVATAGTIGGIAIGRGAIASAGNMIGGSGGYPITNFIIGNGETNSVPAQIHVAGTGGAGTDIVGAPINVCGGKATGNAQGGVIRFYTSNASASSTTPQSWSGNAYMTPVDKATVIQGRFNEKQSIDVAAANNLTIPRATTQATSTDAGNKAVITGATQINLIDGTAWEDGASITLLFAANPLVKHNQAPSGSNLAIMLAGSIDFATAANSRIVLTKMTVGGTTSWWEVSRTVA